MLKTMKIHFITLYVPNSKFKLHGAHNFCCMYELQYTVFFPGKDCFMSYKLYAMKLLISLTKDQLNCTQQIQKMGPN